MADHFLPYLLLLRDKDPGDVRSAGSCPGDVRSAAGIKAPSGQPCSLYIPYIWQNRAIHTWGIA